MHWLAHVLGLDSASGPAYLAWSGFGLDSASGPAYLAWSGFGGDLAIIGALLAAPVVLLRKHNCEVHHCLRLARHATAAGHHVCRRHHPGGHLTAQAVEDHHRRALLTRAHSPAGERLYNQDRDAP